ncbi:MAG: 4'-phosphopantetheinyl transferase superfamily protein [Bryobacteraceae bacterium]
MSEGFSLGDLFPAGVRVAEIHGDDADVGVNERELASLGRAGEKRKREFLCGRECARRALTELGLSAPVLRGESREPIWPSGVCGSITHCEGYGAAAVAWQRDVLSIGFDAETIRTLAPGVVKRIGCEEELAFLKEAPAGVPWELLLFSAKESVFKAWFPLERTWLGFQEATIYFDPLGTFRVEIRAKAAHTLELQGRYQFEGNRVMTSAFAHSLPG